MQLSWAGYTLIIIIIALGIVTLLRAATPGLKCLKGPKGGTYCVRERVGLEVSVKRLAQMKSMLKAVVEKCASSHPDLSLTARMVDNFDDSALSETTLASNQVAYSENKGDKIALCLDVDRDGGGPIDDNTLAFVALHELAHVGTKSSGHTTEFWDNFRFILKRAVEAGFYSPVDYSKSPVRYCGTTITHNPYYDSK